MADRFSSGRPIGEPSTLNPQSFSFGGGSIAETLGLRSPFGPLNEGVSRVGSDLSSVLKANPAATKPRMGRGPGFHASDTLQAAGKLDELAKNFVPKPKPKEEGAGFFDTKSEKQMGAFFLGATALDQRDTDRERKHAESDALQDLRRKYGDQEFVQRHAALESQMNNVRSLTASISSLRKQMEGLATGDQRQTFASDPVTGRRVNG